MSHRVTLSSLSTALLLAAAIFAPVSSQAQTPVTPMAGNTETQARAQANVVLGDSLQQMTVIADRLHRALLAVNVAKWKAPGDVRQTTQADVDSMVRDLTDTLPSLVNAAQADTGKISPAFSVYRNVDALYDVLLRVAETAQLASANNDARLLEDQRATLESSRTQLGSALLRSAQAQDSEVTRLRTSPTAQAPAVTPTKTVIEDGPAGKSKTPAKRTRKPAATPQ